MNIPKWIITAAVIVLLLLAYWIYSLKTDVKITKAKTEVKATEKKIDSVKTGHDSSRTIFVAKAQNRADLSTKTKTNYEKPFIADADYLVKCSDLANYRP